MNQIINVDGKDYPFHFGMRVFWYVTQSGDIEFDQVDGRINSEYDAFLEIFVMANRSALKRKESEAVPLSKIQLEKAIDNDPNLMFELQEAFQNSKVVKRIEEREEEEDQGNEKEPTG